MSDSMKLCIWDVEHGACATLMPSNANVLGRLAMIDCGDASDWSPSDYIKYTLGRSQIDYLMVTNADQDHLSSLDGLVSSGIYVATLTRNPNPPPDALRAIKQVGGMSKDIERFLSMHGSYNAPITEPFNSYMDGITKSAYFNSYPRFTDTNNLSAAIFISYQGFKILFPGDLEEDGWLALLEQEAFRAELSGLTILVASHHGRHNGYCAELFDYCSPHAVVMSDKAIVHDTQHMAQTYHYQVSKVHPDGVNVATTGKRRHVLTTRRDGHIEFTVLANGEYYIHTEYRG